METLTPLVVILTLAFLVESMTEYFFADGLTRWSGDTQGLKYVAALVGVSLALLYGVDALRDLLGVTAQLPYAGEVLTGLILGRGANFVHDFYRKAVTPPAD